MSAADLVWWLLLAALVTRGREHRPGGPCGCRMDEVCPERRMIWRAEADICDWRPQHS